MGSRVLSLWLPYLAIDRIRSGGTAGKVGCDRRDPAQRRPPGPAATVIKGRETPWLVDLCPLAERAGLAAGMPLVDAQAQIPSLNTYPADSELDEKFLRTLATWCDRYTPWVAVDRTHAPMKGAALWLDIASSAHLFGGEARLLADLLGRLQRKGITAQAAIGDHPGTAWAACRFGTDEQRILPVNGARVALASLPTAALRLNQETCTKLERQGLDRIEHLYPLPRRALSARFGDQLVTRFDQALGLIDEPIAPDAPLPAQQAQLIFVEPVTTHDAVMPLVERLLRQLCIGLEAAGLGARRLALALYRVDNSTVTLSVGARCPCRDIRYFAGQFGGQIENIDLGFGLERAILDAVEIEPHLPETISWRGLGTDGDMPPRDLASAVCPTMEDKAEPVVPFLIPETGHPPAICAVPVAGPAVAAGIECYSMQPQHHFVGMPTVASHPAAAGRGATALKIKLPALEQTAIQETPSRPLRLLRRPEPIEAIAPLPDEPPVLFRWRQGLHKVVRAQGPERIDPDWWRIPASDSQPARGKPEKRAPEGRDYFAVEDSDGDRFWLFREGRYDASVNNLPRWYLHGVFS